MLDTADSFIMPKELRCGCAVEQCVRGQLIECTFGNDGLTFGSPCPGGRVAMGIGDVRGQGLDET